MVGQDDSGEDWEAIGGVERAIIVIVVDAGQLLGRGGHKSEGATRGPEPRSGPHPRCFPCSRPTLPTLQRWRTRLAQKHELCPTVLYMGAGGADGFILDLAQLQSVSEVFKLCPWEELSRP